MNKRPDGTDAVIVSAKKDRGFAGELRAALAQRGMATFPVASALPSSRALIVLLWSAGLDEEARASGAPLELQALIGLWSEGRLVVVRRDDFPLPLGLRDTPSLPPSATIRQILAAVAKIAPLQEPRPPRSRRTSGDGARSADEGDSEPMGRADLIKLIASVVAVVVAIGVSLVLFIPKPAEEPNRPAVETAKVTVDKPAAEKEQPSLSPIHLGILVFVIGAAAGFAFWLRRARRPVVVTSPPPVASKSSAAPGDAAPAGSLFVSYSHQDRRRVEPIVSTIESLGRRVWMDRENISGQSGWAGQIVRAIRDSRAVVLMASANSYASDQVVRELYLAMNHKKPIVPIELEMAEVPDELQYILAPFQRHRLAGSETKEVLSRALAAV
jgi:hypothetical protein